MSLLTTFTEKYNAVFDESDPRIKDWVIVTNPIFTFTLIGLYLLSIYVCLPQYMKSKQPYNLKKFIFCYNIFQILACSAMIYHIATPLSNPLYAWTCEQSDISQNPRSIKLLNIHYFNYWIKVIELVETLLFVLRKKYNQVTKLHVYHHIITLLIQWCVVQIYSGRTAAFVVMVNCFIHVIMYTYYLVASLGPDLQKKIAKWKSIITSLQMIQFCAFLVQAVQVFKPECKLPKIIVFLYIPFIIALLNMFWNFFKQNYMKGKDMKVQ